MKAVASQVLIVDDDHRNIFALKAVLKARGFDCITAGSGRECLNLLGTENNIGIVLLDMMMPDLDGYETLHIIRSGANKTIPVIAVTAQAMVGDKEKCLEAGADAYVSKPIQIDQLLVLMNDLTHDHAE